MRWDIFCTVIDNFGDIGITWRLARQLVAEQGQSVRLWVDDLNSFQRLCPGIDPILSSQVQAGVEVRHWRTPFGDVEPAEVVVEALACRLPDSFECAMATRKPVWINLEYLSAEDWVVGCHALPSPHPRLPLTKYFFMPGYLPHTGGVLKEAWLIARRDAFQNHRESIDAFWLRLGLPDRLPGELRVSMFCYESHAIAGLLASWSDGKTPVRCLVPIGKSTVGVAGFLDRATVSEVDTYQLGALTVHVLPMLEMDDYDCLLWASDCNFVRGEDSFVRAQWAGKPLVWQAYRQQEQAHWPKIEAFLALYGVGLEQSAADALCQFWRAWNADNPTELAWPDFWHYQARYAEHASQWQIKLESIGDLASKLVKFCKEKTE